MSRERALSVKHDLLGLAEAVTKKIKLPDIERVFIPEPNPHFNKHTEFGMVVLEDGSAGLYYAWLGDAQKGMNDRYRHVDFIGKHPIELARYFASENEADCSLGLAAINAISQCVFRKLAYRLDTACDSMGSLHIGDNDHVGMVGYFPSLVKKLRGREVRLTVIEKKEHFHKKLNNFEVTMDMERLRPCNKIMSTASALLNNSIDQILEHAQHAEVIVMIGPTAGFFPDPLFSRGVSALGGAYITEPAKAIKNVENNKGMGEAAGKYLITREQYPGLDQLICSF